MVISHHISTVRAICDEIVVLYSGRQVELAPRAAFRQPPFHPYTELLVESVPELRPGWLEETGSAGPLPPIDPPAGERLGGLRVFVPRCPLRINGLGQPVPPPPPPPPTPHPTLPPPASQPPNPLHPPP